MITRDGPQGMWAVLPTDEIGLLKKELTPIAISLALRTSLAYYHVLRAENAHRSSLEKLIWSEIPRPPLSYCEPSISKGL